jgi:hypothetical protein
MSGSCNNLEQIEEEKIFFNIVSDEHFEAPPPAQ